MEEQGGILLWRMLRLKLIATEPFPNIYINHPSKGKPWKKALLYHYQQSA